LASAIASFSKSLFVIVFLSSNCFVGNTLIVDKIEA